jgi:hypothetical protein
MQEEQMMSSSTPIEVFINNEKAKGEPLDFTMSPWHWTDEAFACLSDLIATENPSAYHSLIYISSFLSKTFDAYSMLSIISSIIFF